MFIDEEINMTRLDEVIKAGNKNKIDLLKIDTEGYELNVLKGSTGIIENINLIYFEHHFDDMILKEYSLSDIHNFLTKNNFKKIFKIKMKFRKSFEYIYQNIYFEK